MDAVSEWIKTENDKRMAEAEALKARFLIVVVVVVGVVAIAD